jgi:hypothetical protein
MSPIEGWNGEWLVNLPNGEQKVFNTNAQAWRYIDRLLNEPISRAEHVSDWIASKIIT